MLHEIIPFWAPAESAYGDESHSNWAHHEGGSPMWPVVESKQCLDQLPEKPSFLAHAYMGGASALGEKKEMENGASNRGDSLFQESFFFCTVKKVGDVPGAGCIYVETVVDRDSGFAFAKVYSAKRALNAVDILASRVVPYFERQGIAIKEIHTRKTSEYYGLTPVHPFENFLAASHIQHLHGRFTRQPYNYLSEQFYKFLLKEFFLPALRRRFQLSLDDLQEDLDAFIEAYNAARWKHENEMKNAPHVAVNFPVDL
jgi:hypothetical protein